MSSVQKESPVSLLHLVVGTLTSCDASLLTSRSRHGLRSQGWPCLARPEEAVRHRCFLGPPQAQEGPEAPAAGPPELPTQAGTQLSLCMLPDPSRHRCHGVLGVWDYEYQRIPLLINHMPVKIRRAHMGMGVRSGFSPQRASRNSYQPSGQKKFPTEELHDIQGELQQIKAQVDSLLQSLEHVDQQQVPPAVERTGALVARAPHAALSPRRSPGVRGLVQRQMATRVAQTRSGP
ncbi:uncharacterized protein [Symphalangus syndactylus]|uniref:uncharacterized protein isoform X2 n=1 Tax=Symphalangus syndactylus TaxID=9590 RepID=UPI003005DA9F